MKEKDLKLVNMAISYIKKERKLIDMLLKCKENNEISKFEEIQGFYKSVKNKTDVIVEYLISNCNYKELIDKITSEIKIFKDDSIDALTLLSLVKNYYVDKVDEATTGVCDSALFEEEDNRALYCSYLWALENGYVDENIKKSLHNFMKLRLLNSRFARDYFSGDYDKAEKISNPDNIYGRSLACSFANLEYDTMLNKRVDETNNYGEMFKDLIPKDIFDAKCKLLELEFLALCILLQSRDIEISATYVRMTDFTIEILKKASLLSDLFNQEKEKQIVKKKI